MGSFDYARASLREPLAPLRMTSSGCDSNSAQDDNITSIHTLAVLRHHFHIIERCGVDINRNPPRSAGARDEDFPFPLLVSEAEEICLIIYLKIQQLLIPLKNLPRTVRIFTDTDPQSVPIRGTLFLDPSLRSG